MEWPVASGGSHSQIQTQDVQPSDHVHVCMKQLELVNSQFLKKLPKKLIPIFLFYFNHSTGTCKRTPRITIFKFKLVFDILILQHLDKLGMQYGNFKNTKMQNQKFKCTTPNRFLFVQSLILTYHVWFIIFALHVNRIWLRTTINVFSNMLTLS